MVASREEKMTLFDIGHGIWKASVSQGSSSWKNELERKGPFKIICRFKYKWSAQADNLLACIFNGTSSRLFHPDKTAN